MWRGPTCAKRGSWSPVCGPRGRRRRLGGRARGVRHHRRGPDVGGGARRHHPPRGHGAGGIPFASAAQVDWPNPMVLAELALSGVNALGWWALPALQVLLVTVTLLVVLADGSRMAARAPRAVRRRRLAARGRLRQRLRRGTRPVVFVRPVPFVTMVRCFAGRRNDRAGPSGSCPDSSSCGESCTEGYLVGLGELGVWALAGRSQTFVRRGLVGVGVAHGLGADLGRAAHPRVLPRRAGNEAAVRRTGRGRRPTCPTPSTWSWCWRAGSIRPR